MDKFKELDEIFAEICKVQLHITTMIEENEYEGENIDKFYWDVMPYDDKMVSLLEKLGDHLYKNIPRSDEREGS